MRPEKKVVMASEEDYEAIGVDKVWIPALQKMGFFTIEALREANPNKIFKILFECIRS